MMSNPALKGTSSSPGMPGKKAPPRPTPSKTLTKPTHPPSKTTSEPKLASMASKLAGKKPSMHKKVGETRGSTDGKSKGFRQYLQLTPQEKKRRLSVARKVRNLLRQRKRGSVTSIDSDGHDDNELQIDAKRYKRPVEKLLKRLKTVRKDQLPSDINIHRRRYRRPSFIGAPGVRKEVDIIHKNLLNYDRKVQPQVGFEYSKKQRRLLLGFRHRQLDNKWHYFGAVKDACTSRMRPNSHVPDAFFLIVNLILLITTGVTFGFVYASDGFIRILEESYEYELYRIHKPNLEHQGYLFWINTAPFDRYENHYYAIMFCLYASQFLGFVGIYVADQKYHLAYIIGMVISLLLELILASDIAANEHICGNVNSVLGRLLELLVENYEEKIVVKVNNIPILDKALNPVEIKTYKAANVMDRIQKNLHCCGINGIADYTSRGLGVPPSCCTPLWNLNPHCSNVIPTDKVEYRAKFQIAEDVDLGCLDVLMTMCVNLQRMMGSTSQFLNAIQWLLFFMALIPLIMQARQIRQLKRWPHLRISAGSISQSLQASAGSESVKTGGGGVRAVVEASKFTEKQQERLQQTRRENLFKNVETEDESSESSEESSDDLPVHTVNFGQLKNLQQFVDTEDKTKLEMPDLDKTVEGFAGRFNILANKNLQNYVSGIFSTTYQNETNAGLEAIAQTLERQFAQHTTDYNWRKLLTKKKEKEPPPGTVAKVQKSQSTLEQDPDEDSDEAESEAS